MMQSAGNVPPACRYVVGEDFTGGLDGREEIRRTVRDLLLKDMIGSGSREEHKKKEED